MLAPLMVRAASPAVSMAPTPSHHTTHTLLSHNHMLSILRAFLATAKWDVKPNEKKGIYYTDHHGYLSLTAVAATVNTKAHP